MKLLYISHHYLHRQHQAMKSTLESAKVAAARGHEVTTWSFEDFEKSRFARSRRSWWRFLFPYWVRSRLRQLKALPDVIEASSGDLPWGLPFSSDRSRKPVTITFSHGSDFLALQAIKRYRLATFSPVAKLRNALLFRQIDRSFCLAGHCVFLNSEERDHEVQRLGLSATKCHLTSQGVGERILEAQSVQSANSRNIALLGSAIPRKGVSLAAKVLNRVLASNSTVCATWLGTGNDASDFLARIEPTLKPRVTVVRQYSFDELPQLLNGFGIYFFPTLHEGFGKTLVEAMALGLCPVASDLGGPRDILTTETPCGFLVNPDQPDEFARVLLRLISDDAMRVEMARHAKKRAQDYSWAKVLSHRIGLYEQLAGVNREAEIARAEPQIADVKPHVGL
jgi:glycosyltransferase involved in cell wall biosynthesis